MKRKKHNRMITAIILVLLILVGGAACGCWLYIDNLAYKVCRVEAGVTISPSDFMKNGDAEAFFTENSQPFDITVPGEYAIEVQSGWFSHRAVLYIEDTIAPEGEAVSLNLEMGETCGAQDLVSDIKDATMVSVTFAEEPDFTVPGEQRVDIILQDMGGNVAQLETSIFISQVVEALEWEAGSEPPVLEEFVIEAQTARFVTDMQSLDMCAVGDHKIKIQADDRIYEPILHIVDTIPPIAEVKDITGFALVKRAAEDFVVEIEDVTHVSVCFQEEPDLTMIGTQEVQLLFVDEGQNETVMTALLTLEKDTEPPVITGARDIQVLIGDGVSYKNGVAASDNCPEGLQLTVDNSSVNLKQEGTYPVTYTATDLAGNTVSISVNVTVRPKTYTEEEVYALADRVLGSIITPEMSALDKVQAIYNYNMKHIAYISHSDKGNWLQAAYEGLAEGKGDCYVYACTAKALLTRAGITNMDIAKIPAKTLHYWNLVDIGDGWYHFDTTPRKDHPTIFMWTDEQLMSYSQQHGNSHNYDHSLYPEVN